MTILRENILQAELEFPRLFASVEEKDYGLLFYNEHDAESHDSNHAVLYPERVTDFNAVLAEITKFYLGKGLVPRIYQPFTDGYFTDRRETLERHGYHVEQYGRTRFMLLTEPCEISVPHRLDIRRVTAWDERIARDIYLPAGETYEIEVERNSIRNENYVFLAGYLGDEIAAMLSFHESPHGCTRFDNIVTAPKHRGQGYAQEMLRHAVLYVKENGIQNCYQWPAHETSERISHRAGFRHVFDAEAGCAVYEGQRKAI